MDVQALVSQAPAKGFNEGVFDRLAWVNEIELYPTPIGPIFQHWGLEFDAMIHGN